MNYLLLLLGMGILMSIFVFNGTLIGVGKLFGTTRPVNEVHQGPSAREKSSEQARETYEKNQRMMDDLRDKLDRRRNN